MRRRAALLLATACGVALAEEPFTCDSGKVLPEDYVNDDYCDCEDGSDESNTGACAGTTLLCANRPHVPFSVLASRVNDGICDCCDGADEWAQPALCPNKCVHLAR